MCRARPRISLAPRVETYRSGRRVRYKCAGPRAGSVTTETVRRYYVQADYHSAFRTETYGPISTVSVADGSLVDDERVASKTRQPQRRRRGRNIHCPDFREVDLQPAGHSRQRQVRTWVSNSGKLLRILSVQYVPPVLC